jgi:hypothetical protein
MEARKTSAALKQLIGAQKQEVELKADPVLSLGRCESQLEIRRDDVSGEGREAQIGVVALGGVRRNTTESERWKRKTDKSV